MKINIEIKALKHTADKGMEYRDSATKTAKEINEALVVLLRNSGMGVLT